MQGSEVECMPHLKLVAPAFHSSKQQKNEMAILHLKAKLVVLLCHTSLFLSGGTLLTSAGIV